MFGGQGIIPILTWEQLEAFMWAGQGMSIDYYRSCLSDCMLFGEKFNIHMPKTKNLLLEGEYLYRLFHSGFANSAQGFRERVERWRTESKLRCPQFDSPMDASQRHAYLGFFYQALSKLPENASEEDILQTIHDSDDTSKEKFYAFMEKIQQEPEYVFKEPDSIPQPEAPVTAVPVETSPTENRYLLLHIKILRKTRWRNVCLVP
nr:ORF3 protein [Porcine parvovirus 4]